jgi:molecular chaperone DnaK
VIGPGHPHHKSSAVAVMEAVTCLRRLMREGNATTPLAVVGMSKDGDRLAGQSARRQGPYWIQNTFLHVKRLIGRKH